VADGNDAPKLTIKQESFARAYVELGNASLAYRQAYKAENMSDEAVKVEACRLLQHTNVALTVDRLKAKHAEKHEVTVDWLTEQLKAVFDKAMAEGKGASAAVSAVMGMAKLHGHIVEKKDVTSDNRHHHTINPVSAFDGFLAEAAGTGTEGDTSEPLPN
jgi:phage terminase small subunit